MNRTRLVSIAIVVCAFSTAADLTAQTPAPPDGWVVLPVDEYRALRDRANPPPPQPAPPPVNATLTRIDYDLRIESDAVAGRALLTIDVLRDGWTPVQIPAGLMVRDARLDGQPVSLVEGPPPHVLLSRTGRVVLTLDIAIPLTSSAGTESIALPASASPITRATLTLPRSGVELTVAGGFVTDRAESAAESRFTAFGRPNQPLTLSWKRKVDDRRAEQTLRTRARVTTVVGLGEDISQVAAAVRVEVLQGLAREVTLALPPGLVINQVNGPAVADWETASGMLRLRFLDPVATEVSFLVLAETRAPREGSIAVPLLRMPSAERETGGIAVDVVGAGEIAGRLARGLEPADPSELGEIVAGRESPSMIAFRLRPVAGTEPRSLNVTVVRYLPQAVLIANVEEARYRALAAEDGQLLVEARYAVRNNQRSFLKVKMPPGSMLWSAKLAGRPVRPGVAEQDAVLLPLEKGRAGEEAPTFVVELVYLQPIASWGDKGAARVDLPVLDLPISRTGLELHHSPRFRVALEPGTFRLETDPGPFAEALRPPPPPPPAAVGMPALSDARGTQLKALVDRFRSEAGGRVVVGALPVQVMFPAFGPSVPVPQAGTARATIDLPGEQADVRLNSALHSLARLPVISAFRYQRTAATEPGLALDVKRFADAGVLAAVADRAVATTLVTSEGRALTEVTLTVRNRAQPFLRVTLPPGASISSVEIAGQPAKPAQGADGTRVPLLRPGLTPGRPYEVSFVYLHAGTPFARKGDLDMTLPKMDMPIGIVEWEVFVPERYSVRAIGGNAIDRRTAGATVGVGAGLASGIGGGITETVRVTSESPSADTAQRTSQASPNVINLQRRAQGVLPVRIDVPRAGTSHQFVKPLVVDQETVVKLRYKQR